PDEAERPRRLDWEMLMKRTWGLEVLICLGCAGRMRMIALIESEQTARRMLTHLGLPARAPPRGCRRHFNAKVSTGALQAMIAREYPIFVAVPGVLETLEQASSAPAR